MSKRREIVGSSKAVARLVGLGSCALFGATLPANAGEMKIPRNHPQVALEVPDNWSIERSAFAVAMTAPEKNSIVLARVLVDKAAADVWTKEAGEKLKTFGVQFDANAKTPSPPPQTQDSTKDDTREGAKEDATKKKAEADAKSAFTTDPDAFTFSGAPSLRMPGTEGSNKPVKPADNSLEGLTGVGTPQASSTAASPTTGSSTAASSSTASPTFTAQTSASTPKPKLPFHAVQILGATMNGKPVDVQVVIYTLPSKQLFVMMQESGSDDGRAVAMAQSVRGAN